MQALSHTFKTSLIEGYKDILQFWQEHSIDQAFGGFYGEMDRRGKAVPSAPKGLVLNARILWTFSSAYNFLKEEAYLQVAHRAYQYLIDHFWDKTHGGLFWSLNHKGELLDGRKQIYAQGFGIYGLSEYYKATHKQESLDYALELYHLIEKHSADPVHGGYLEALSREWGPMEDMRLSPKDANEPKSMNTHLHIIEPYTNLFRVWPKAELGQKMEALIRVFLDKIIDNTTAHFQLFFERDWTVKSNMVSYGHDIEGAWLLHEAAEVLGDPQLLKEVQAMSLRMAEVTLREGCSSDGSIFYEKDLSSGHLDQDRHWWVQAEGMVGFMDAWQISGQPLYLEKVYALWAYIEQNLIDRENGEWFLSIDATGKPELTAPKGGFWKCPYHNTRALMELTSRIKQSSLYLST
ncbi:AGE family epimerase/isomerase [Geofilum rubicundum]|uniref:Cellobiose 2-epimerase n=1 Tax=Geofilum rubicundum JCM 15548 TaxID=1236989 RepID=A0A0E9LSZ2_9BACT|nr:AGE family epimerase/isomerase [Geofilum rubicundum]GAO28359.1 N-acylglucosamine 2-epimerase [Geofilum rubicundum JCM 15548]